MADKRWYMVVFTGDSFPIWTSDIEPGGLADIDAARTPVKQPADDSEHGRIN